MIVPSRNVRPAICILKEMCYSHANNTGFFTVSPSVVSIYLDYLLKNWMTTFSTNHLHHGEPLSTKEDHTKSLVDSRIFRIGEKQR
jgi:hypothetical protein